MKKVTLNPFNYGSSIFLPIHTSSPHPWQNSSVSLFPSFILHIHFIFLFNYKARDNTNKKITIYYVVWTRLTRVGCFNWLAHYLLYPSHLSSFSSFILIHNSSFSSFILLFFHSSQHSSFSSFIFSLFHTSPHSFFCSYILILFHLSLFIFPFFHPSLDFILPSPPRHIVSPFQLVSRYTGSRVDCLYLFLDKHSHSHLPTHPSYSFFQLIFPTHPSYSSFLLILPTHPYYLYFLLILPTHPSYSSYLLILPTHPSYLSFLFILPTHPSY